MSLKTLFTTAMLGVALMSAGTAVAAERGQAMTVSHQDSKKHNPGRGKKGVPPGWQKKVHKGQVLDYDLYRAGEVVYRDPLSGVVSVRIDKQVIRVMADTRKVIDIFTSL